MTKTTHKTNGDAKRLDLEHELPESFDEQEGSVDAGAPENQSRPTTAEVDREIDRLKAERATYLDRLARLQAEFDNYRKRSAREQQEFREYAIADAIKQLLPILDSLDNALKTESASAEDFRNGMELIDRQFHDVLSKLGVEPIAAAGEPFDPTVHQAIQMVETTDAEDNHVIDELQRGYKLRDRLLRAAMVRVASNPKK